MNIVRVEGTNKIKARISRLKSIESNKKEIDINFSFNWELEFENEVFNILSLEDRKIIGLMSILDIQAEYRIHINLIESSIVNRGKQKQIKNIPHCLISYACKQAFALGYDGFVSLYPKTELINYYINEYGFQQYGRLLAIYGSSSFNLIKQYLDE